MMATRDHGLFRRLDRPAPDAAEGGCFIYHTQDACIDTGILVFGAGTLTLSCTAIKEMAEVAGFTVDAEGIEHEIQLAEQARTIELLTAERDELLLQLNAIGTAVSRAAGKS
jgi:hypothetical protein